MTEDPRASEVYYTDAPLLLVGDAEIAYLKQQALKNFRGRSRLCAHASPEAPIHEMIIVQHRSGYIRPHAHLGRLESLHIIEGLADLVLFSDDGELIEAIPIGPGGTHRVVYFRMTERQIHGFILDSEFLIFHETTSGPFNPDQTMFPPWAPADDDGAAIDRYWLRVREALRS